MRNLDFLDQSVEEKRPTPGRFWKRLVIVAVVLALAVANGLYQDARIEREQAAQPSAGQETPVSTYVSGDWGQKLVFSDSSTYPFVFLSPLKQCRGFTLEYTVSDITEGTLTSADVHMISVRTTAGNWKDVGSFIMNGSQQNTLVFLDEPMDIDAVSVMCQTNANLAYSYSIAVRDPVF